MKVYHSGRPIGYQDLRIDLFDPNIDFEHFTSATPRHAQVCREDVQLYVVGVEFLAYALNHFDVKKNVKKLYNLKSVVT